MGLIPSPVRMMLPLAVVYYIRGSTFDDEALFLIRGSSAVVQLISVSLTLYLYYLVHSRDDQTGVQLRESEINPPSPFASAPENDPIQRWTAVKYDKKQTMQLIQQAVMSILVGFFIHIQWGYVPPIIMTPIMGILNFIDSPLFALYFLNRTDRDDPDLKRPFKKQGPFAQIREQMDEIQRNTQGDTQSNGPRRRGGRGGRGRSIQSLPANRGRRS